MNYKLRITNWLAASVLALACVAVASDVITKQERKGPLLIVTYEGGRVETNSLFLAMNPDVKREMARIEAETMMVRKLAAVIADTKANIPEAAGLENAQVAMLYLAQTKKSADDLRAIAPTNTMEYLIGAGMRQDLSGSVLATKNTKTPDTLIKEKKGK